MQSSKELKASKQAEQKYSGKGLVMGVISADSIIVKHSGKEDPFDGIVHLAFVQAPRIGSSQRVEEAFAFEAREAIREKIIGRKCSFTVQYQINGRRYLTLKVDDEDVASILVSQGLAKPTEKRSNMEQGGPHEALIKLSEEPKAKKVGVWATEPKHIEKHTRQVVYFGESDYMPAKLLAEANKEAKPLAAVLEHVFSASYVTLYVYRLQTVVKMSLLHLFTPQSTDKDILEKGKAFMEKMLLHKTVGVKLARVDESGGLVGRIFFSAGEIAAEVLKSGYSKLSTPKDSNFDAAYYKELKQAQMIGQTKRAGIWHDLKDSELQQNKSKVDDFCGRVVEINSGDSLTIEKDSDLSHERIFLSSVKAPGLGRIIKGETSGAEPYSWESKESLRKLAIGKKVKVEMEYSREVQSSRGGADFCMNFGAIFLTQKNHRNLAVL
jgi:staphylococcal nuclease domain-containing protein 1